MPILIEQLSTARRSLRIAVVTETYPPEVNGVAMSCARAVEGLLQGNHQVQLIRPRQDGADRGDSSGRLQEVLMRGIAIPRYPALKMGLPARRALTGLWTYHRPDLVHLVTEGPLGWSALQAALKLRLPVCSDFRTNFHAYSRHYGVGWLSKPILGYLRKFHNRTALTMVPTESMRAELSGIGFRNVRVVARGVDTRLFAPARRSGPLRASWGAAPHDPVVVHVGRLAPEKNLSTLVEAFGEIRRRAPRAKLVLVGDGPARRSLEERFPDAVYAGMRHGEDLAAHYASGDVFLFPSLTETYGNVTLEALASGLAVVAFDYAAAAEHIRHGHNGAVAKYGDTAGFVATSAALAADPVRIRDLGARARQTAMDLDWSRIVQRLEALFLAVMGSDDARPHGGPATPSERVTGTAC
jgi:glycosyltransferase involved in cell wall biosynthesis